MVDPLSFHALTFNQTNGCLEHSVLLTVTSAGEPLERVDSECCLDPPKRARHGFRSRIQQSTTRAWSLVHPDEPGVGPQAVPSNPTTGFLTATTFIYALGAGITAAAGTRLALQWILISVY